MRKKQMSRYKSNSTFSTSGTYKRLLELHGKTRSPTKK